ncbi:retrotransposon protein, putative, ty1-copia subclass [Tanacetum coccineum]
MVKKSGHSGSTGKQEVEAWRAQLSHRKQEDHTCDKDWKVQAHAEVWNHSYQPQKMENATTLRTDDFSRYGYVYLIKHKSDTFEMFKRYQNKVENQLGRKIKVLRSDRGGEYLSIEFFDHLKNCGIVSQLSPPRTPQLNGVAERRNRTLLDMVRSMMCRATLPISLGYT